MQQIIEIKDRTWRELITEDMENNSDSWDNIESIQPTLNANDPEPWIDKEFDTEFGSTEGTPFTIWTKQWIYFPVQYDGSEWVESIPRHPHTQENWKPYHYGGG